MEPTLGRFVQRDPLGYVDGMNVFRYGRSNPMAYTDPMGLCSGPSSNKGCSAPAPATLTREACCFAAKSAGCDNGSLGGVVCCGGKLVKCVWSDKLGLPPGIQGLPVDYSRPGDEIVFTCVMAHEEDHLDDVNCDNCPANEVCRPHYLPGKDPNREECSAYKEEYRCLNNSYYSECDRRFKGMPTEAQRCRDRVFRRLEFVNQQIEKYCGSKPQQL